MHPVFKVFKIPRAGLDGPSFSVLVALASFLNDQTGRCFPSIPTLAKFTAFGATRVKQAIKLLVDVGRVEVVSGGGRRSNNYVLHLDVTQPEADRLQGGERLAASRKATGCQPEADRDLSLVSPLLNSCVETVTATASANQAVPVSVSVSVPHEENMNGTDKDKRQRPYGEIPEPPVVSPFDKDATYLVSVWKRHSTKPVFKRDFIRLYEKETQDIQAIEQTIHWMFTISDFWASESPNWKGEFDITSSGSFVTNFDKIDHSRFNWYTAYNAAQEAKTAKIEASCSTAPPDCAVAPLTREEEQDMSFGWDEIEVEGL
jgi:hypothetical protein